VKRDVRRKHGCASAILLNNQKLHPTRNCINVFSAQNLATLQTTSRTARNRRKSVSKRELGVKKIDARGPGSESSVSLHRRSRSPPLMQRGPITLSPQISDQGGSRSSRRASSSAPPPRRSRRTRSRRTRSRWRPACPACCRPPVPQSSSHRPCQYLS